MCPFIQVGENHSQYHHWCHSPQFLACDSYRNFFSSFTRHSNGSIKISKQNTKTTWRRRQQISNVRLCNRMFSVTSKRWRLPKTWERLKRGTSKSASKKLLYCFPPANIVQQLYRREHSDGRMDKDKDIRGCCHHCWPLLYSMSPGYVSWYQWPSPMPTPSIRLSTWLPNGCCAIGGLVHESIGFVFLPASTICATSPAEAIAFRFAPRMAAAPAPNDLWPRPPRGITPAEAGYWWYMKSGRPRPYGDKRHWTMNLLHKYQRYTTSLFRCTKMILFHSAIYINRNGNIRY